MPTPEQIMEVLDTPSRWGEQLAGQGLSPASLDMARAYGTFKDALKSGDKDDLAQCALKEMMHRIAPSKDGCDPGAGPIAQDLAAGAGKRAAYRALGSTAFLGLDILKDVAGSALSLSQNHRNVAELMGRNGVPGFAARTVDLKPGMATIVVDATAETLKEGGKPKLYLDYTSHDGQSAEDIRQSADNPFDRPRLEAAKKETLSVARDGMYAYIGQNGLDAYKERLKAETVEKLPDYLAPAPKADPTPSSPIAEPSF